MQGLEILLQTMRKILCKVEYYARPSLSWNYFPSLTVRTLAAKTSSLPPTGQKLYAHCRSKTNFQETGGKKKWGLIQLCFT